VSEWVSEYVSRWVTHSPTQSLVSWCLYHLEGRTKLPETYYCTDNLIPNNGHGDRSGVALSRQNVTTEG
jgi:hypothetical protein